MEKSVSLVLQPHKLILVLRVCLALLFAAMVLQGVLSVPKNTQTDDSQSVALLLVKVMRDGLTACIFSGIMIYCCRINLILVFLCLLPIAVIVACKVGLGYFESRAGVFAASRPLFWTAYYMAYINASVVPSRFIMIRPYVARFALACIFLSLAFSIYQLGTTQSYFGTTILGPRTTGLFANPIHQSFFYSSCFLMCSLNSLHAYGVLWCVVAFGCLMTGGRAGLLTSFSSYMAYVVSRIEKRQYALSFLVAIPVALGGVYYVSNLPYFSGREDLVAGEGEARWTVWTELASNFDNESKILWGLELDLAVTGIATIDNGDSSSRQYVDGTWYFVFASFGLVGALCILLSLSCLFFQFQNFDWMVLNSIGTFLVIAVFQISQNIFEQYLAIPGVVYFVTNMKVEYMTRVFGQRK